jgi:tetratricopeptide (TPR) repeat protein
MAYYNCGYIYEKQGNLSQAISDLDKAIEINPNYADAYETRAYVYFDKKEYEKAWANVHKAEGLGYKPDKEDLEFLDKLKKVSGRDK